MFKGKQLKLPLQIRLNIAEADKLLDRIEKLQDYAESYVAMSNRGRRLESDFISRDEADVYNFAYDARKILCTQQKDL